MKKYFCERCGHEWIPRVERKPKACPGCKNYKWDEERKTLNNSIDHKEKA